MDKINPLEKLNRNNIMKANGSKKMDDRNSAPINSAMIYSEIIIKIKLINSIVTETNGKNNFGRLTFLINFSLATIDMHALTIALFRN